MFPGARVACLLFLFTEAFGQSHGSLRFAHPVYNESIPENSVGKTYAEQPPGEDTVGLRVDPEGELDIRYRIIGGDRDKFFKAEERLVGDFCFLSIRTRTGNSDVLNRERKDKYVLEVRASASKKDGKNKVILEADTTVIVKILDTNDLNPLFYPTSYSIDVAEDIQLHKSIIKVSAEDADLGPNGEIYYSFLEDTDQFAVHPTSGVVTITRPLLFSENPRHELTVLGEDRGALFRSSSSAHASRAKLVIRVKRVNLFSPEIFVHHLPDIVENSTAEIYAIVNVVDKDDGVHGQIRSLEIVDGDPDGHFRILSGNQPGEFNIVVHALLDREQTPQGYNLTLKATDLGVPPKQSYKSIPVHLADVNDNAPIFNREIYEINVPETAPINTPVIRLKVTDKDLGKNAQVFLEIVGGNEGGEFYVNPDTGMLYTAVALDAESKAFYTLTVSAIDQGNTGTRKQSSAKVKINVLDTNDNDPLFDKSEITVLLNENEPAGTSVTKVTARDKDSGENAYISYSIANLNPVPFEIDHFSGVIRTIQVLDYESMKREYILRIRASDWGLPYRRQTEMQLTIILKDINDNRPQFEKIDCTGHVPRYVPIGSEIITLSAIDFDAGNIISYKIVAGNEDNCFSLDSTSGVLSVSCDLKDIRVEEREVNVTATDGRHYSDIVKVHFYLVNAKKSLTSTGRLLSDETGGFECKDTGVARRLTEVLAAAERNNMPGRGDASQEEFAMMPSRYGENVHTPEYVDFPLEIKVNESVSLGTTLIRVKARDRDLGYNGKLIFGISGGDPDSVFRIDPESGDLKIIGYLDRERENEYYLNISVYDLGKPQKSVSRVLPITVLDVNDNAPKFEKSLASFRVTENAINGTAIFKVNATDADSIEFSIIKYFLVTDTRDFSVDPVTGILIVSAPLDRERQGIYELRIRAQDNGGLYSDASVRVTIDDINDNTPRFSLPTFNVKIREDVPRGTVVAIVNAVDPDLGSGGEIHYSIIDEGDVDGIFKIDTLSGTIRTAKLLDFEERQVHSLTIRGTDRGLPALFSETTVIIDIVDVNENIFAPAFNDFVLEGSVRENQPIGTKVFAVKATDADPPGGDSRITYSIRGGDGLGYFTIDNEGQIRTTAILDTETKDHYWLTVCAQDMGVVPLHSCVKVYIVIEDENDCVPLTVESTYRGRVAENSPGGRAVLQLEAVDRDSSSHISYRILSGDPGGLFDINPTTGVISTTGRLLDRESQSQHSLEVQVSDGGDPLLTSATRVLIDITDLNDNWPVFLEQYYSVRVPAGKIHSPRFQKRWDSSDVEGSGDAVPEESAPWETYDGEPQGRALLRVIAYDKDEGENGNITYSIKSGKGKAKFHINPRTGVVVCNADLEPGSFYELNIRALDNGVPPKAHTTRVSVEVVAVPENSAHPPIVKSSSQTIKVTESDNVGFLVSLIQATDEDNDTIWYDIVDGDERNDFFIGRENGNVLLAKKLMWETQSNYTLNISVTDGVHSVYTQLKIIVINDVNEQGPTFSRELYSVNISENFSGGDPILSLHATGRDHLLYSILNARNTISAQIFKVDSLTGDITMKEQLDREVMEEHLLTVMVRDQALKSKRSYARVLIRVIDHNDHPPEFSAKIVQGKVYETSAIGTLVVRVLASDKDKGENAVISYSITSGNIGNMFSIDPEMGDITVSRELDLNSASEYMLQVKASNPGPHPSSTSIPVHIMITMADNASPRFVKHELVAEIFENEPPGTYVEHLEARSTSSLLFEITGGDDNNMFDVNPSTGVITTKYPLDYEQTNMYNLTVSVTNMASARAQCSVVVHVLDKNDNAPRFLSDLYYGSLLESAPISSLVLSNNSAPLVISTEDLDSETNALRSYEIIEPAARQYFTIDSTTGAVKTISELDHETVSFFTFHVMVVDLGKPRLSSETTAEVQINILDVNDCPPRFDEKEYNVTLLLPTYKNVAIVTVNASDPDTAQNDTLKYDILDGDNANIFSIDTIKGVVTILYPEMLKHFHRLRVRVTDGKFTSTAQVNIRVEKSESSGLIFQKSHYEGSVTENSTKIVIVAVVNVLGNTLNEHVEFKILNPTDLFTIGLTSGAIQTTGVKFDREEKDTYLLIVEAKSSSLTYDRERESPRVAHVVVNVTILDINDYCPMFVNLPYYAVVSVDDEKGQVITKVHAIDMDSMENGEVRYEMKRGHGELFKVCRKTGEISLKQNLEGHNKEYQLVIGAYDGGTTPCYSEAIVNVKVVDRSMPVFDKQFYSMSVPENVELQTPLGVPLQASSPLGRKLIYTIVEGNDLEEFSLDFNTAPDSYNGPCMLYAAEELDYEQQRTHQLKVRATDSVTGVYAEVAVSVVVEDINDCPPEFSQDIYHINISEAAPFGTLLMKLEAHDNDTGINQDITYSISHTNSNASLYFHVETDGSIYLKQSLDRETLSAHHFTVLATDKGIPSLSSTAHVWVTVLDMNDNPPRVEQPLYSCVISEHATRGQFVTRVAASDPDPIDLGHLSYSIVGGNSQQTFSINSTNGIISLLNIQKFGTYPMTVLNVSVSDGVYTTFSRVKVSLSPANRHAPRFTHVIQEATAIENQPPGLHITVVKAIDDDFGEFGQVSYSIPSNLLKSIFSINGQTGELTTLIKLDREVAREYEVPVMASDAGGRPAFTAIRVKVADENDNAPIFLLKEYKAAIHSNFSVSMSFLKIKAVDSDDGLNGKIQYSIYETKKLGVSDIFGININTGSLTLVRDAESLESQVFQFWVRATDLGKPALHSDVSVEVYIMSPEDRAPIFERNNEKFFVPENSPQGTVITRLKMVSEVSATYRILPGLFDQSLFQIDSLGQLVISGNLDRETKDSHLIGIIAETQSSPPLSALAEITLNVLDENDNAPMFHSSPYVLTLAENVEQGTSILKITAQDRDSGSNGEVRYALGPDMEEMGNVFAIDPYTGWITTLVDLDREAHPDYKFQVLASDNAHHKHVTNTTVIVRLKDYNDCPPVFTKTHYEASVNEDALPGTVVLQLEITDEDAELTPVEYYVTSGDPLCQFQIRSTGEVYIAKPLDREVTSHYKLEIITTDGRHSATTTLAIEILDANDNPPYCLRHRYRETISEGTPVGTYVMTIKASDADQEQNAKLRYYLSGENAEHFIVDKQSGEIKTAIPLDREQCWKYQLMAHVQDKEKSLWECSSEVEVLISDINDNTPQFSMGQYSVTLPEDVEVGTLVTKVHASDQDLGINRKVRYSLIDSLNGQFLITADSGIVTVAAPLDRETESSYSLEVRATDLGSPSRWSQATIQLTVSDINDNPPEFATKYYYAIVPEIDSVGTEVVRVLATSKDIGINADISYSIVGGNEHKKFSIDLKTGVMSIAEPLDYERAKEYFLTIQAKDGGIPPLSNLATVNISVTDSNDNAPIFTQSSYNTRIREDAEVFDKILQVTANDIDSGSNGRVSYSIERGDRSSQFSIDVDTGYLSVASQLDRESQSSYVLEVHAKDNGIPVMSSFVMVNIEISDANDNPPLFSQSNYTAVVQEDKTLGHMIFKFIVSDADAHPNAAPYTFDFISGNEAAAFRLEQDGFLRTATRFNHKIKDHYVLQVRVFDNGSPPLFSDAWVVIKIIEESQYPPVITPLDINVNSYMDEYTGGEIGKVFASDQDPYDTLSYSLSPTNVPYPTPDLFRINESDGTLVALPRLDIGDYRINVSVSDGKFSSSTIVKVNVELISEEMLRNSVVVRFREITPRNFVLSHRKGFIRTVRNTLNCRLKDIIIISVQPSSEDTNLINHKDKRSVTSESNITTHDSYQYYRQRRQVIAHDLDVLFAVKKLTPQNTPVYYSSDAIRKALNNNLQELEESTKLIVEKIIRIKCSSHYCAYGECLDRIILDIHKMTAISADVTSLVSPLHQHKLECKCQDGYGGERCETVINECARKPCPDTKKCFPDQTSQGYTCQCVEGHGEGTCEVELPKSKCYGENCFRPLSPVFFGGKSYAQYKVNKENVNGKKLLEDQLSLTMRVRTVNPAGNLMYAAGKIDYNILEIVNGIVQYRLELGSGEGVVRVASARVSDGRWHEIRLQRDGASAKLTVDGRHVAHGSAPGANGILNLYSDDLFIGAEVRQHPAILGLEDVCRGFVGCLGDVRISDELVPLQSGGAAGSISLKRLANVERSCPATLNPPGPCGSLPCQNGGTCKDLLNTLEEGEGADYECQCHDRFTGPHCELDTDPCASQPCLYGGICSPLPGGEFECRCGGGLRGRRCEVGRWCGGGGACLHGGLCEEGDAGPTCRCHGYYGPLCEMDIDECKGDPCLNGATCINEPGSFRCVCPPDKTGMHCGNPLHSDAVISGAIFGNDKFWWIIYGAAALVVLTCFIFLVVCCIQRRKRNHSDPKPVLNSMQMKVIKDHFQKLSNLEVQRGVGAGVGGERPASYAPASSTHCDLLHTQHNNMLINNLDTLRSYGSAGDDLETIPPDYLKNLNRDPVQNYTGTACGDADSLHKPSWSDQMHLQSFQDNRIKNDLKGTSLNKSDPVSSPQRGTLPGRLVQDPRMLGGYHWDCSDWCNGVGGAPMLSNITEVPGSEVPDSSSFHSNESNESRHDRPPMSMASGQTITGHGQAPANSDMAPLNEEESSYAADEDEGDITDDVYKFNEAASFLIHPNTYLPRYVHSSEGETGAEQDTDGGTGVESYGFPSARRRQNYKDDDINSIIMFEERNSLLGRGSASNLSVNVCEIEESESEFDSGKASDNWTSNNGVQHTSV